MRAARDSCATTMPWRASAAPCACAAGADATRAVIRREKTRRIIVFFETGGVSIMARGAGGNKEQACETQPSHHIASVADGSIDISGRSRVHLSPVVSAGVLIHVLAFRESGRILSA